MASKGIRGSKRHTIMEVVTAKYWNLFKDNAMRYVPMIANNRVNALMHFSKSDLFSSPCILLYGNATSVLMVIVDVVLQTIFGEKECKKSEVLNELNGYNMVFARSSVHIEFNFEDMTSAENKAVCEYICKELVTTKNIHQEKHLIVLHNIHRANVSSINALKHALDKTSNTCFILTSPNTSQLESSITSRCAQVRCNIPTDAFGEFISVFTDDHNIEPEKDVELDPFNGIIRNLLLLSFASLDKTSVEQKIDAFVQSLFADTNTYNVAVHCREFANNIAMFNIHTSSILKHALNAFHKRIMAAYSSNMQKVNDIMYAIVILSADIDRKNNSTQKQALLLEAYFIRVHQIIHKIH